VLVGVIKPGIDICHAEFFDAYSKNFSPEETPWQPQI
jgi:hypothetical protein